MSWTSFLGRDMFHPHDAGMKAIADVVVHLIQQTAFSLFVHPPSPVSHANSGCIQPVAHPPLLVRHANRGACKRHVSSVRTYTCTNAPSPHPPHIASCFALPLLSPRSNPLPWLLGIHLLYCIVLLSSGLHKIISTALDLFACPHSPVSNNSPYFTTNAL